MPVTYLVLAHRGPQQVARLVDRLGAAGDRVVVHVDRKVDITAFSEAFARLRRPPVCLDERVDCHWGGFGHVEATLIGMREALRSGAPFSHLVLLTGQDYPLRPAQEIQDFFSAHPEDSYLSWSLGPEHDRLSGDSPRTRGTWRWDGDLKHLMRWHVRFRGRWQPIPPIKRYGLLRLIRPIPGGLPPAQGLAYWNLSREAVEYCAGLVADRPEITRFFKRVPVPDENMFQMMLVASPLAGKLVNDDLRYMDWVGWHPRILEAGDRDELIRSGRFFARKFDQEVDGVILDQLDAAIRAASPSDV